MEWNGDRQKLCFVLLAEQERRNHFQIPKLDKRLCFRPEDTVLNTALSLCTKPALLSYHLIWTA